MISYEMSEINLNLRQSKIQEAYVEEEELYNELIKEEESNTYTEVSSNAVSTHVSDSSYNRPSASNNRP